MTNASDVDPAPVERFVSHAFACPVEREHGVRPCDITRDVTPSAIVVRCWVCGKCRVNQDAKR